MAQPATAAALKARRLPHIGIDAVGNHHQPVVLDPQPGEHLGLELGEDDHPVEAGQGRGIDLVSELLGAAGQVAQAGVKGRMEGGHQRHPQLLAEIGQQEVERREGEAGVHQIRFELLQRFPQLPLGAGCGDRVHL